jgi:hypothetical protein
MERSGNVASNFALTWIRWKQVENVTPAPTTYQYADILLASEVACKALNPTAIRHWETASWHVVSLEILDLEPRQKQ